jgi:hypothetical protein
MARGLGIVTVTSHYSGAAVATNLMAGPSPCRPIHPARIRKTDATPPMLVLKRVTFGNSRFVFRLE